MSGPERVEAEVWVAAARGTVFRYFTDPERFARWMGAGSVFEATAGGALRVQSAGAPAAVGTVESVVEDREVVFTWGYEGGAHGIQPGATRVTVRLEEEEGGTRVRLVHTGFTHPEQSAGHRQGWRHYLAGLAVAGAGEWMATGADAAVTDWFAAWGTDDADERAALLGRCWGHDAIFRDGSSYVAGRDALVEHIANARRFAPGLSIHAAAPAAHAHDAVRFAWRIDAPDGTPFATGTNFGVLGVDGRFRSVVGFWDPPAP